MKEPNMFKFLFFAMFIFEIFTIALFGSIIQANRRHHIHDIVPKERIYEYEVIGNDTILVDSVYIRGVRAKTYYYID